MTDTAPILLLVDDDADIFPLAEEAFKLAKVPARLRWLGDGQQLLDHLKGISSLSAAERPALVLLDLNMPRLDGRKALSAIKSDPALRALPVLVLTSVDDDAEVRACYENGANAFLKKPFGFSEWQRVASAIGRFWLESAILPESG